MASIRIRATDFSGGALPEVCARTGGLARSRYRVVATGSNGPVAGMVPLSRRAVRDIRTKRLVATGLLAYGALATLAGWVIPSVPLLAIGVVLLVTGMAAVVWLVSAFVRARVSPDGQWVTLKRVHERFAAALNSPPAKCDGCTGAASCSVAEMHACEGRPTEAAAASG